MNIRQNPCLKTCSLPSQFIVERYLSISYKKEKKRFTVQLGSLALCLKPGITPTQLSLLAPCLSSVFWDLRGWLAGLGWGGAVGVRGLAGDELTGYYWLYMGLVHKSPLSPMARTARTTANKIK